MFNKFIRFTASFLTIFVLYISLSTLAGLHFSESWPVLSLSSPLLPVSILLALLLMVFWLVMKSYWTFVVLVSLLINGWYLGGVFRFHQIQETKLERSNNTLTIGTYNIKKFDYGQTDLTISLIAQFMSDHHTDILCLQEFDEETASLSDSLFKQFAGFAHKAIVKSKQSGFCLVIYSHFPIIHVGRIPFKEQGNQAMFADLLINADTVRVFNVHMQTTNFNQIRFKLKGDRWIWNMDEEATKTKHLISHLKENNLIRIQQTQQLKAVIESTPFPVLLGGDMNSTPASSSYFRLSKNLYDGFKVAGSGYEYTYRYFHKLYRIDYLFYSDPFKATFYKSYNLNYSDHKPVLMTVELK